MPTNNDKKKSQSSQSATSQAAQHAIEAVEFKNTLKDISSQEKYSAEVRLPMLHTDKLYINYLCS